MAVRASSSVAKERVQVESELETRAYCGWVRWASWVGWQPTMDKPVDGGGWGKVADAFGVGSPQCSEHVGGGRDVGVVDGADWTNLFGDVSFRGTGRR